MDLIFLKLFINISQVTLRSVTKFNSSVLVTLFTLLGPTDIIDK